MTTAGPPPSAADERGRASWLNAVSGGFLALVLVGGLGVVLWPEGDQVPPDAAVGPALAGGDVVAGEDAVPTVAPADVSWELVSGRAVPRSASAGPTRVTGAVHAGFARTPTGAVMAALNIFTRATMAPGQGWLRSTEAQIEPGPGRDVYVEARGKLTDLTPPVGGWGQTAGFRVVSYSPTRAVIEQALAFSSSGRLQVQSLTVAWRAGDWHLVLQPDGESGPYVAPLPDLDGFVVFSGGI